MADNLDSLEILISLSEGALNASVTKEGLKARTFINRLSSTLDSLKCDIHRDDQGGLPDATEHLIYAAFQLLQSQSDEEGAWAMGLDCLQLSVSNARAQASADGKVQAGLANAQDMVGVVSRACAGGTADDQSLWNLGTTFLLQEALPLAEHMLATAIGSEDCWEHVASIIAAVGSHLTAASCHGLSAAQACPAAMTQLAQCANRLSAKAGSYKALRVMLDVVVHVSQAVTPAACLPSYRDTLKALLDWLVNVARSRAIEGCSDAAKSLTMQLARTHVQLDECQEAMELFSMLEVAASDRGSGNEALQANMLLDALRCQLRMGGSSADAVAMAARCLRAGCDLAEVSKLLLADATLAQSEQQVWPSRSLSCELRIFSLESLPKVEFACSA
jgi:hypothetical protein